MQCFFCLFTSNEQFTSRSSGKTNEFGSDFDGCIVAVRRGCAILSSVRFGLNPEEILTFSVRQNSITSTSCYSKLLVHPWSGREREVAQIWGTTTNPTFTAKCTFEFVGRFFSSRGWICEQVWHVTEKLILLDVGGNVSEILKWKSVDERSK